MALREQILSDIKEAMKKKDSHRLTTLRMLQSAVKNKEIELRPKEIADADILDVLKKLVKQRQESIEQYQSAGRNELADKEKTEIEILSVYLPEQLSEDKVQEIVDKTVNELGASSMKDMGAVMKEVVARTEGAADNKVISQLVKARLQ